MTAIEKTIDAAPTKDFFIRMLIRDIELIPAIGDLADNSIDGARRLRGEEGLEGLVIRIVLNEDHFRIEDNCGGIPLHVAEKYAFRFGRPEDMEDTPHSIGQFGVGMKRALFKLGNVFEIASTTESSRFTVKVDVAEWRDLDEWKFEFADIDEGKMQEESGTTVEVSELHEDTTAAIRQSTFVTRLARELGAQHQESIDKGLIITVNGAPVGGSTAKLLASSSLSPSMEALTLFEESDSPVTIRIYAGISDKSDPGDAGWYVYCNGRLVVGADKSSLTGWGVKDEARFPQFHNRYGRFRGYVFFDSDDASKLPWTTTKTSLNTESAVYQSALQAMRLAGRPVAQFLYDLSREVEMPPEDEGTELAAILTDASLRPLASISTPGAFSFDRPLRPRPTPTVPMRSIQYKRTIAEIEEAQSILGVDSASEVGQRTFDYFIKREGR